MKIISPIVLAFIPAAFIFAQPTESTYFASVSGDYRIALAKTTIHVTEWHEESFWDQYEGYLTKELALTDKMYSKLGALGTIAQKDLNDEEAFELASGMIRDRYEQLTLWQEYFTKISAAHHGVIALKFLQTEVLLDMLESARAYEQTPLRAFRMHPIEDTATLLPTSKQLVMIEALKLHKEQENPFFTEYTLYSHECDDLLGLDYSLVAAFATEPSDYTPGQAKIVGANLLEVVRREIKLKEKYLNTIHASLDGSTAARFLAWEDYYSIISKMDAWAEAR